MKLNELSFHERMIIAKKAPVATLLLMRRLYPDSLKPTWGSGGSRKGAGRKKHDHSNRISIATKTYL